MGVLRTRKLKSAIEISDPRFHVAATVVNQVLEGVALYSLSNIAMHEGRPLFMDPVCAVAGAIALSLGARSFLGGPHVLRTSHTHWFTAGVEIRTIN